MIDDKKIDELTQSEIVTAINTKKQVPAISLAESAEELRAMGIPDISEANDKKVMNEALKNIQITKILEDHSRNSHDKKSIKEYINHHIEFLESVSDGKTKIDIIDKLSIDHIKAMLKTTAKMSEVDDEVIKKHLKTLRKKYK